jgi:hypothetical protein
VYKHFYQYKFKMIFFKKNFTFSLSNKYLSIYFYYKYNVKYFLLQSQHKTKKTVQPIKFLVFKKLKIKIKNTNRKCRWYQTIPQLRFCFSPLSIILGAGNSPQIILYTNVGLKVQALHWALVIKCPKTARNLKCTNERNIT